MTLDWRRAVGLVAADGHRAQNRYAMELDVWREEVWKRLRSVAGNDLHREVLCGRMSLIDAAKHLEERGFTVPPHPGMPS